MKIKARILLAVAAVATFTIGLGVAATTHADSVMRKPIDYQKPSETVPYPDAKATKDLNILVKLNRHRVYIRSGKQIMYTMYCSAGMVDPKTGEETTPIGQFELQSERGDTFYNKELKEGATAWTSFKNHGEYLFHSVPTDANGNYKPKEAKKLGKTNASHGCIRLSIPDAKYIQTLPAGTPVTIER